MKSFVLLSFLVLAFAVCARAETHYLLVDPGTSWISNYYRFYNDVRRGYETLKALDRDVSVVAKGGHWIVHRQMPDQDTETLSSYALTAQGRSHPPEGENPSYPPIAAPFRKGDDLADAIQKMKLKSGDSVVVFITPHGNAPASAKDPAGAALLAWSEDTTVDNNVSYRDLARALSRVDQSVKIKIVNTACYGGGVHSVARDLPNVCSAAVVNFQSRSSSGTLQEYEFSKAYWSRIHETKGKLSFADAALHGFRSDIANPDMGSLSSSDYADYVLEKGPYARKYDDKNYAWSMKNGVKIFRRTRWPGFQTALPADAKTFGAVCPNSNDVLADLSRVERLARSLNDIVSAAGLADVEKKIDGQPAGLRTVFHDVIEDMKKNGARYEQLAEAYDRKVRDLKAKWESGHGVRVSGVIGPRRWMREGPKRAEIQKGFEELRAAADRELKRYYFNHQMLERLDRLGEFEKKATAEQKRKYLQLLQCEWESL